MGFKNMGMRPVVVIGMLAVVRKLILLEVDSTSGAFLVGLAATILALGLVLLMIGHLQKRDERERQSANQISADEKGDA